MRLVGDMGGEGRRAAVLQAQDLVLCRYPGRPAHVEDCKLPWPIGSSVEPAENVALLLYNIYQTTLGGMYMHSCLSSWLTSLAAVIALGIKGVGMCGGREAWSSREYYVSVVLEREGHIHSFYSPRGTTALMLHLIPPP
jgi:hypothetical protein